MLTLQNESSNKSASASARFEMLYLQTYKRVFALNYRVLRNVSDAEDVTQEAFLRAWQHFDRYDTTRSFEAWIFRIATNLSIDFCRRKKRNGTHSLSRIPVSAPYENDRSWEIADSSSDPVVHLLDREWGERVCAALQVLPQTYLLILLLLERDHTYEEIATILRCPVGTLRSRVHRMRKKLQRTMETLETS